MIRPTTSKGQRGIVHGPRVTAVHVRARRSNVEPDLATVGLGNR
jgi:hypothetical protein